MAFKAWKWHELRLLEQVDAAFDADHACRPAASAMSDAAEILD